MKKNETVFKTSAVLVVLAIFVFNLIWVHKNQHTPYYDNAGHINMTAVFANVYRGAFENIADPLLLTLSNYYPPLMYYLAAPILIFADFQHQLLQFFANTFLVFSAYFLYMWARELSGSIKIASLSAMFFVLLPHVWEQARYFMLDLPFTTFILASLLFLSLYRKLNKDRYLVAFLLFAVFAQLTKWYAFVYLSFPAFYYFYQSAKEHGLEVVLAPRKIFYFTLALLMVVPWYLVNLKDLVVQAVIFSQPDFGDPEVMFSIRNTFFYPVLFINYQVVSLQFVWLTASVLLFARSGKDYKNFLFVYLFAVYLIFTFLIGNKNLRYLMPLLPVTAIIMAEGIDAVSSMGKRLVSGLVVVLTVVFSVLVYGINSFSYPVYANTNYNIKLFNDVDSLYLLDLTSNSVPYHWKDVDEVQREIFEFLADREKEEIKVLIVANNQYISVAGLDLFAIKDRYKKHKVLFIELPLDRVLQLDVNDLDGFLKEFEYLIIPKEYIDPVGQVNFNNISLIKEYVFSGTTRNYELINTFTHDEAGLIYLLQKNHNANNLVVTFFGDKLMLERQPAIANIYLQLRYFDNSWQQIEIQFYENRREVLLDSVETVRIDYPPETIDFQESPEWLYDGEKQFDRI